MSEPKQKPYYRIANGVVRAAAAIMASYAPQVSRRLVVNAGVELLLAGISLIRKHGVPHAAIRALVEYTENIDPISATDDDGILDVQSDKTMLRLARLIVNADEVPAELVPDMPTPIPTKEVKGDTKSQVFFQSPGSTAKN
jgi:hypothetical protein